MTEFQELNPVDAENAVVPIDEQALYAEIKRTLEDLRHKGVDYLVMEGMGYQFYIEDVSLTGEVVNIRKEQRPDPADPEGADVEVSIATVKGAEAVRDFQINLEVDLEPGQIITASGVASFFNDGAADFIAGVTLEQIKERIDSLKELLNNQCTAVAFTITEGEKEIYNNAEAAQFIEVIRSEWQDRWEQLLAEFQ